MKRHLDVIEDRLKEARKEYDDLRAENDRQLRAGRTLTEYLVMLAEGAKVTPADLKDVRAAAKLFRRI